MAIGSVIKFFILYFFFRIQSEIMSTVCAAGVETTPAAEAAEKKPLKPCCACPETKKVRDEW